MQDADKDDITLDSVIEKSLEGYGDEAPVEAAPAVEETPAPRDDGRDEKGRFKSKAVAEGGSVAIARALDICEALTYIGSPLSRSWVCGGTL